MAVVVKTIKGLAFASAKTVNGLAVASMKSLNGLDTTAGGGGPSLVAHTGVNGGTNGGTTSGVDTTGANLLVVVVAFYPDVTHTVTVTDSKSNTYTSLTNYTTTTSLAVTTFYCASPTVGSGHTFTFSGSQTYSSAVATAWSGMDATPFDVENGTLYTSAGVTSFPTGSVTPSQNNTLLIAGLSFDLHAPAVTANISIDSGFTISDTVAYAFGSGEGCSVAYKILTSAAATNPAFASDYTTLSGPSGVANIAGFKY